MRPFCALAEEHRHTLVVGHAPRERPDRTCPPLVRRRRGQLPAAVRSTPACAARPAVPARSRVRRTRRALPPRTGRGTRERDSHRAVLARRLPTRFDRRDRSGEAFQLQGPERDEFERGVTAHGESQQLGGQDLAAGAASAHRPGGLDDGVSEEVAVFFDGLSGGETDPDPRARCRLDGCGDRAPAGSRRRRRRPGSRWKRQSSARRRGSSPPCHRSTRRRRAGERNDAWRNSSASAALMEEASWVDPTRSVNKNVAVTLSLIVTPRTGLARPLPLGIEPSWPPRCYRSCPACDATDRCSPQVRGLLPQPSGAA